MTITMRRLRPLLWGFVCAFALINLSGCQRYHELQGEREGPFYYSPAAAYSVDLSINTFRGEVELDERCDRYGGSTTFWDASGRMFRIDYLRVEDNPNIRVPRFASNQTLMTLVLNGYLRGIVAESPMVRSTEIVAREFVQDSNALFALVSIDVNTDEIADTPDVTGNYYYGFFIFKRGPTAFLVQHRQPALMKETMKSVLIRLADAIELPGRVREDTELEQARRLLAKLKPGEVGLPDPIRLCEPEVPFT